MGIGALRRHYASQAEAAVDLTAAPAAEATKSEWAAFARALGLQTSGNKGVLVARVTAHLEQAAAGESGDEAPAGDSEGKSDESTDGEQSGESTDSADGEPEGEPDAEETGESTDSQN